MSVAEQLSLFEIPSKIGRKEQNTTTFTDNMRLPIHRWFRYSAGFSAEWVKKTLRQYAQNDSIILDPFAGSGTTLVVANELFLPSIGFEKHYFVRRIANIKLNYAIDTIHAKELFYEIINIQPDNDFNFDKQPDLLKKCYSPEILKILIGILKPATRA